MAAPFLESINGHIDTSHQRLDSVANTMQEADNHLAEARWRIVSRRAWLVGADSRQHRTIYTDAAPPWNRADAEDLAEIAVWATRVLADGGPGQLPM